MSAYTGIAFHGMPQRWPSSDVRMDTTHAYFSATLDPDEFNNIAGMPILMELYVNQIKDLKPSTVQGAYDYLNCAGYAVVNDQLVENSYPSHLTQKQVQFITSYCPGFFASPNPSMSVQYWSFRGHLSKISPTQHIGRYLTGSYCRDEPSPNFFPPDVIDCYDISPRGHRGLADTSAFEKIQNQAGWKRWLVNPKDATNITVYQNLITNEAIRCNSDFVFFDNMAQISYMEAKNDTDAEFVEAFIQHLRALSKRLNGQGYGAVYNMGKLPTWHLAFKQYPYLEGLFDSAIGNNGVYLEQPFRLRDNPDTTEREIRKLQSLLAQGALVVFSPYPEGYADMARAEWMAAMALLIREPGDGLFVVTARDIDSATNHWKDWPLLYGQPSGQVSFVQHNTHDWSAQRTFAKGEVTAVHIFAEAPGDAVQVPVSAVSYQIIPERGPKRGTWNPATNTYTVDQDPHLDCKRDDGYSDRFILGANPNAAGSFYEQIIAVDVVIQSHIFG